MFTVEDFMIWIFAICFILFLSFCLINLDPPDVAHGKQMKRDYKRKRLKMLEGTGHEFMNGLDHCKHCGKDVPNGIDCKVNKPKEKEKVKHFWKFRKTKVQKSRRVK